MEFYRLVSAEDALFAEAFDLYRNSFPEYEQRLPAAQTAVMADPLYHFEVVMDDGAFTGILLYWEISFYTYIEHFAVHPSIRGKSFGSRILETFCENHPLVILEIDPPVTETAIRRELFYQRRGFTRNAYAHTHPAYRTQFPPHELVVMSYPRCLTEDEYRAFRRELDEVVMSDSVLNSRT